jgi:hypothetical protein
VPDIRGSTVYSPQGSEGQGFNEILAGTQPRQDVKFFRSFLPCNVGKSSYLEAAVSPIKF